MALNRSAPTRLRFLHVAIAVLVATVPWTAHAQQDAKVSREREALRRSQAALRQAQEQQAVLTKEKADLAAEKGKRDEELKRTGAQLGSVRGEVARLQARVAQLAAEVEQLKADSARDKEAAAKAADTAAERIVRTERLLSERTQTVTSLTALLERSTTALAASEEANRKMYAFGREMIEQYRRATSAEEFLASEPVIGFAAVRRENVAEDLRTRLDAARLVAQPAR
jgi:chromosome segregation ATPase